MRVQYKNPLIGIALIENNAGALSALQRFAFAHHPVVRFIHRIEEGFLVQTANGMHLSTITLLRFWIAHLAGAYTRRESRHGKFLEESIIELGPKIPYNGR